MDKFKKAIEQLNKPDGSAAERRPKRENGRDRVVIIKRENAARPADPMPADTTPVNPKPANTLPPEEMLINTTPAAEEPIVREPKSKADKAAFKSEKAKQKKSGKKKVKNKVADWIPDETDIETGSIYGEDAPRKNRAGWVTLITFAVIALAVIGCFANIRLNNQLRPVFYQLRSSKVVDNVRVVAISDMHLKEFGENNIKLVDKIKSYHPDIIAVVGDMNIDRKPDYSAVMNLCARLNDVAPLYYSLGNHEFEAMLFEDSQIYYDLKAAGIKVLNNETDTIDIGLSTIDIIGLTQSPQSYREYGEKFFDNAMNTGENFKLVLTHYPELFDGYIEDYPIDLAISGHAHGGQVRLPFIGGLYSSDQGILPKLCEGLHEIGNSNLVISKGLGRSGYVPRINNPPEITIIDINWY